MRTMLPGVIMIALALGGCREKQARDSQTMGGMDSMGGMAGMGAMTMHADSMMPAMKAHLDSLTTAPAAQRAANIAAHEAMTSQMLDAMGADMTAMGMKSDSSWAALRDSVQRDLADLPGLSGAHLEQRMRAHLPRLSRLLAMHEAMMQTGSKR